MKLMTATGLRALSALLNIALLSGCLVGPSYETPEFVLQDDWRSTPEGTPLTAEELAQWWQGFGDPTLDVLVERASTENLGLRRALARIEEVRAKRGLAKAAWFPDLDLTGGATRSKTSLNGSNSNVAGFQFEPRTLYDAGLDLSWELDLFGRVRRSAEAAHADVDAAVWSLRDTLIILQAEVATSYIDLCAARSRLAITRSNLGMQSDSSSIANARYEAGLAEAADATQASVQVHRTTATIPPLIASVRAAENHLCILLGVSPGTLDELLSSANAVPIISDRLATGIPADVLRQRPDVRRAERELAAQTARIGVATADLYPSFSISGSFSYESAETGDLFEADSEAFRFGPKLRWNLLEFGRIRQAIRVENARAQASLADYEDTVLRALEEVENALENHAAEIARRSSITAAVREARRAAGLVQTLYEEGEADYQNTLDALRTLADLETTSVENESGLARAAVTLFRALGGGWQERESQSQSE